MKFEIKFQNKKTFRKIINHTHVKNIIRNQKQMLQNLMSLNHHSTIFINIFQ